MITPRNLKSLTIHKQLGMDLLEAKTLIDKFKEKSVLWKGYDLNTALNAIKEIDKVGATAEIMHG